MKNYKVKVLRKYIEIYVVAAESKQEAEQVTYEGMHDWLDPIETMFKDTKVKCVTPIREVKN